MTMKLGGISYIENIKVVACWSCGKLIMNSL